MVLMNDWSGKWCCGNLPGEGVTASWETLERDKFHILVVEHWSLKPLGTMERDENEVLPVFFSACINPSSIN